MSELPKGWVESTISEITSYVQRGKGPKYSEEVNSFPVINQKAIRWFGIQEEHLKYVKPDTWASYTEERFVRSGDILWNSTGTGTIGRACLLNDKEAAKAKVVDSHVTILRVNSAVEPRYLFYWIRSPKIQFDIESLSTGTTNQVELSKTKVLETKIPLAPLNEQKRIADKLDSILAKVDRAQARLDKIPGILKRFRQAVLAAATSGELTRVWRGSGAVVYTDITGLSIPVEWRMCTIEDIGVVKGGKRLPKGDELTEINTGFPYIRAGQLKHGTVVQGDSARNRQMFLEPETQKKIKRYTVNEGDVYLTIVGASIGDAGVIPRMLHQANLTENAAKITDFTDSINAEYLSIWLRSERLQELIQLEIKSGAQGKLALKRINTLPVPLPPVNEQNEITRVVGELLSYSDSVEKSFEKIKLRIDRLTQSILTKAFRGELVEQNAADEPADKLLERIKQQQLDAPKSVKKPRNTSKRAKNPAVHSAESSAELEQPQSGILSLLKNSKGELTVQQIIDQLSEKTFEQVDALFTELKRLLDSNLIIKVGADEACAFKAVKR